MKYPCYFPFYTVMYLGLIAAEFVLRGAFPLPAGESTVVFRDSAFANDVAKTNLAAILNQHGLGNVRSL